MRKAFAATFSIALALVLSACTALGAAGALLGNDLAFSAPQLQRYLDLRFPRDYDKLGGLVTLSVLNPRLTIPRGESRLRLDFDVGFGAIGGDSRTPSGHIAVASGLRYDANTRGLHLADPTLESIEIPKLGGTMNRAGVDLVNRWLQDYARDEPVYRLDDATLGRIGGRRIADTRIQDGRVFVQLAP